MRIINMGATNLHLLQELSETLKTQKTSTLPSSLSSILERVTFTMDILEIGPWEALEVRRKATYCDISEVETTSEYVRKSIRNTGFNPTNNTENIFLLKNCLEWADCIEKPDWLRGYYRRMLLLTPVCARNISVHATFKGPQILSIYGYNFDRFFETRPTDSSITAAIERNLAIGIHQMIGDGFSETLSKKDMITNSYLTSQVYADMPKTKQEFSMARIFNTSGWCLDFTDEQRLTAAMAQEDKGDLNNIYIEFSCNTDLNTFLTFMLYQDGDMFKVTDHMDYLEMTAPALEKDELEKQFKIKKETGLIKGNMSFEQFVELLENEGIDSSWISELPFKGQLNDTDLEEKYEDLSLQMRGWYNKAVNKTPEEEQTMEWLFMKHMLLPGNTSIRYSIMIRIKDKNPSTVLFQPLMDRAKKPVPGLLNVSPNTSQQIFGLYDSAIAILKKIWK